MKKIRVVRDIWALGSEMSPDLLQIANDSEMSPDLLQIANDSEMSPDLLQIANDINIRGGRRYQMFETATVTYATSAGGNRYRY